MLPPIPWKYALPLFGLATSAFVFNTSEFMPIGLLSDIAASFAMTPAQTGIMITVYAWMVGLLSLPLMLVACRMELRRLLLLTIGLFMLGQLGSAFAVNFPMLMGARIAVACAHSIFWSIAGPLATRLVTQVRQPFALSMIATGSSIAMIFGLPLGRVVGLALGWRMTFLSLAVIAFLALVFLWRVFPPLSKQEPFSLRELPTLFHNPLTRGIFILSLAIVPLLKVTFIPPSDGYQSSVLVELPPGTSLETTRAAAEDSSRMRASRTSRAQASTRAQRRFSTPRAAPATCACWSSRTTPRSAWSTRGTRSMRPRKPRRRCANTPC